MPETLYDQVAYPSRPFQQTHPLRLALPAALFGLAYAPMDRARVLEIGWRSEKQRRKGKI